MRTYRSVWKKFNAFLIKLDVIPRFWEDRTTLFVGHLIELGMQSSTVKSYVSAIKRIVSNDGYKWQHGRILLSSLTRACKLKNDCVKMQLPIHCGLLELILFELKRFYVKQPYLISMYSALFILGYYGLLRVGELEDSPHVIKAKDVHLAINKKKLLIVLHLSKTHGKGARPQKIKITSNNIEKSGCYQKRHFCPFQVIGHYIKIRQPGYIWDEEPFFVFSDRHPVTAEQSRTLLRKLLNNMGLQSELYDMHSLRIGRTSDLIKYSYPIDEVRRMGRWQSNTVFKYIRA